MNHHCTAGYGAGVGRVSTTSPAISRKVTPWRVTEAATWSPSRAKSMSASFLGSPKRSRLMATAGSRSMGMSSGYSPS